MHVYTSESSVKMEVEAAELATVYMKYMESPATVGKLTASAPVGLRVQQTNIAADLATRCPTYQHPTSELPMLTPIPRDESSAQLVRNNIEQSSKFKLNLKCGNWRKGMEALILTVIILMVWALFSIPTIFYALPPTITEVSWLPCIMLVLLINFAHSICSLALWTRVVIRQRPIYMSLGGSLFR